MIVIIDYGAGNIRSVKNALDRLEVDSMVSGKREDIQKAEKVIFPGQGHFGACVLALKSKGIFGAVREAAAAKPFLGICVGMQILFEKSEEAPGIEGLGILRGEVKKFALGQKLPQMGWNQVESRETELSKKDYYFANSYHCVPEEQEYVAGVSFYEEPFVSAIKKGRLLAVQFHPEKSGREGMKLIESFAKEAIC